MSVEIDHHHITENSLAHVRVYTVIQLTPDRSMYTLSIDWFDVITRMKFDTWSHVFSVNIDTSLMNSNVLNDHVKQRESIRLNDEKKKEAKCQRKKQWVDFLFFCFTIGSWWIIYFILIIQLNQHITLKCFEQMPILSSRKQSHLGASMHRVSSFSFE